MTRGDFIQSENKSLASTTSFNHDDEIKTGDILISRANTKEYVGASVLVGRCRQHLLLSDKSLRLVTFPYLDRQWFAHLLKSPGIRREISRRATGTKDSMRNISQSSLTSIEIDLPPLAEQRRIVATLDEYFSRTEKSEETLSRSYRRLENLRRTLVRQRFDRRDAATSHHIRKLGDVCGIAGGQTPKSISEVLSSSPSRESLPFYKVGDLNVTERQVGGSRFYINRDQALRFGLKVRPAGTVLIPKRGGAIHTNKKKIMSVLGCYDLNTMGIVPSERVDSTYLWYWFQQVDLGELADGSNIPQINNTDLVDLLIPIPPIDDQLAIVSELDIQTDSIARLMESLASAKNSSLKRALLRMAFAGRLVEQDPADEPASVLLERIRAERAAAGSVPRSRGRAKKAT
ncbi:restriction endonuclease subunit S [Frankia sp. Cr2]|uniref:restriction endonuclease subunit S n=1 Tax=Frankia sp. Cr2 TaxID=3073932 RepID=UPI002AD522CB|nr:restriction endonuclease subunit S [Frankia sp. Cr2]